MLKVIKQYTEPTDKARDFGAKASSEALSFLPNFGGSAKNVLANMVKGSGDGPARTSTMPETNDNIKKVAHGRLSLLNTSNHEVFPAMALTRATSVPYSVVPSFGKSQAGEPIQE